MIIVLSQVSKLVLRHEYQVSRLKLQAKKKYSNSNNMLASLTL